MNEKIDIVIPWVDGNDFAWLSEKEEWQKKINPDYKSNSNTRYQSWDNLHYLFRAIVKFMPWINKIFFVTWGHVPKFLKVDNPRVEVVKHTDFIPQKYLPTFNVNTIELNLHRIQGLSENFIYFNDDTFPLEPISKDYYFKDNMICDEAIETPIIPMFNGDISQFTWNIRSLDTAIINKHFSKREVQAKNHDKWFCEEYGDLLERNKSLSYWNNFVGFRDPHVPTAFKKSSFEKVWKEEYEVLNRACLAKFRNFDCVNQWLIRYWQICEGVFYPRRTLGKSFSVTRENCKSVADLIREQKLQMICINEDCTETEFIFIKETINKALCVLLPEMSEFEKEMEN